jgi:hypothetical protein
MPRADYDTIKEKFAAFVSTFRTGETARLEEYLIPDISCRISTSRNHDNDQSKISGVREFIETYPKTDVLQLAIYNYACRLSGSEAQQIGYVICESLNYVEGQEEMDVFYYAIMCAGHWIRVQGDWKMDELHMDVYPFYGNLKEYFAKTWYFGPKLVEDSKNVRLPAIEGEYDSPWVRIPDAEDVLTETEKVKDCIAMCFFGMDYWLVDHRLASYSRHMMTHSEKFGILEGARGGIASLRYKRQKDRYWCHPFRFENIVFNEDQTWCRCDMYRVFGWAQRNHEYVWTRSNVGIEHMCSDGYFEFVKEDGMWRMAYGPSVLGLYETGPYCETLYGDRI